MDIAGMSIGYVATGALVALLLWAVVAGRRANVADWGNWWLNTIDGWLRLFCRRYHRLGFDAVPLPARGAALLVSNHVSGIDPFLMITATSRPLRFIIAKEEYERFGLTWLFRAVGCIPVDRDRQPQQAFKEALLALERGEVVALFPEGHIHPPDRPPRRLKRGVARLAELSGAPVYPVRVSGVGGAGHVVRGVLLRSRARLESFAALDCAGLGEHACLDALSEAFHPPRDVPPAASS